jgi:N-acetylneuraminate epimerase
MIKIVAAMLVGTSIAAAEIGSWEKLPPIPDEEGFAAAFAGATGGALVVAGGANIVGNKWAEPFTKKWYDSIFVLEEPGGAWRAAGKLTAPRAYGVSIATPEELICIGGSELEAHSTDVFQIRYAEGKATIRRSLPKLPRPLANSCGALLGTTIYIAGGLESPNATAALSNFWALDLAEKEPAWRELKPWPGPPRMLSVAGVQGGSFFLFNGVSLSAGKNGKPVRTYLRDAYRYTPGEGWKKITDLPRAANGAPSPAIPVGSATLLVPTGDDGAHVDFSPVQAHPGFPRDMLAYDLSTNTWATAGAVPFSRATVPVAQWRGMFVVPNGEVRPRVRTNEVWGFRVGE